MAGGAQTEHRSPWAGDPQRLFEPIGPARNLPGHARQIIAAMRKDIEAAQQTIASEQANFQRLRKEYQPQLQTLYWRVRASRILAETIGRYGNLRHISIITGWVPKSKIAIFSQRLKKVSPEIFIQTFTTQRGGEEQQNVPVVLNNPRLLKSFQSLVTNYAQPRYEEVDPTFLLVFTYPLLFGAMFGDVGQGVVLALLGLVDLQPQSEGVEPAVQPGRNDHRVWDIRGNLWLSVRQHLRGRRCAAGALYPPLG